MKFIGSARARSTSHLTHQHRHDELEELLQRDFEAEELNDILVERDAFDDLRLD
jgi:hypothetical protein